MRQLITACLLLLTGLFNNALAASLSDIRLHSALYEPFKGTVMVRNLGQTQAVELKVGLASHEEMRKAGIEPTSFLTDLRFALSENSEGNVEITITSQRPAVEPFVQFILKLKTPNSQLMRQYSILLDPK